MTQFSKILESWFDKDLCDLPPSQRVFAQQLAPTPSGVRTDHWPSWDEISIEERRSLANQRDRQNQPTPQQTATYNKALLDTQRRSNSLAPHIKSVRTLCVNPDNTDEVWQALVMLAKTGTPPFIGVAENEIKYDCPAGVKFLSHKNLKDRISRNRWAGKAR